MMKYILPYKTASKSARALSEATGYPILGDDIQIVRGKPSIKIINWGKGEVNAEIRKCTIINDPTAICRAVNKLEAFTKLSEKGVSIPQYTTSRTEAASWLASGSGICVRKTVEGRDGEGLILLKSISEALINGIPEAPLYTKFIEAKAEYRINVCNNRTVGVQLKVPTGTNPCADIKTGGNGYGFKLLSDNEIPTGIRPVARAAITALGLDFGGVDLIVDAANRAYVLEVNTAPELTPSMVTAYANRLRGMQST